MHARALALLAAGTIVGGLAIMTTAMAQPATPLIERTKLFGNPVKAQGRLSPDGKWLSWLAPDQGVLNVWVAPAANPSAARVLTRERTRPIRQHFWSPDSSMVMFINDSGGDENFLLYGVEVASGAQKNFTPFEKTRVQIVGTSETIKDRILVGLNNRDARWHDVHSLNLRTGELTRVFENNGYTGFIADDSLTLRVAIRPNAAGGQDYFRMEDGRPAATPFLSHGLDDSQTTQPLGFTADGRTLYSAGSDGVREWDVRAALRPPFLTEAPPVTSAAFSPRFSGPSFAISSATQARPPSISRIRVGNNTRVFNSHASGKNSSHRGDRA